MKKYAFPYAQWIMLGGDDVRTEDPLSVSTDNDLSWDWLMRGQIVNRGGNER